MIIKVTKQDIDSGTRLNTRYCPIARAVKRRFTESYVDVCVWQDTLEIGGKSFRTSEKMANFIVDYDNGLPVKPFSFNLDELVPIEEVEEI